MTTVYLPLVNYGKHGIAFEETDPAGASEAEIIKSVARDKYCGRVEKIVAFNTEEGWSRDISKEIAIKVADYIFSHSRFEVEPIERNVIEFLEEHGGIYLANALQAAE